MNKFINNLRNSIKGFLKVNSMSLPDLFLKYGSRGKNMLPDWTEVMMHDKDHYTGYGYASIVIRANMAAKIALENIRTESIKENFIHPYLTAITTSKTFSDYQFWHDISTYLDLEGVYYLMAVRAFDNNRIGTVKEFKLLNPYNIRRVIDSNTLEVAGYIETRKGLIREIPKEMIIEMRELNPFSEDSPYAITDAAKEAQFTLKTSSDYTRHALRNNINAPGIISTDVALTDEEFANFIERVRNHTKGEPIFGNGQGAITYENMQLELSKSALRDINEINRDALFATTGVSKTIMGIEQSGTTRETSRVQKELSIENHILPRIQMILDALNQDYINHYSDYNNSKAELVVDNPLAIDQDALLKEIDVKKKRLELYTYLINKGIDNETAAKYANGEIDLEMLDIKPFEFPEPITEPQTEKESVKKNSFNIEEEKSGLIQEQEGALQNAIVNIDSQLVRVALDNLPKVIKNIAKDKQVNFSLSDLIPFKIKKETMKELLTSLTIFYGISLNLKGQETSRKREAEFALLSDFKLDKKVKSWINNTSDKVSLSHINTISDDIYKIARDGALKGLSVPQIQSVLTTEFSGPITENRAKTIARTETNRAFTRGQYEADRQFLKYNDLTAYKKWVTRSDNPCPFCQQLASEPPVPFGKAFRDLDGKVKVGEEELNIDFETLEAGNAHPNCACAYELIIK
jgi:hypothetical protein